MGAGWHADHVDDQCSPRSAVGRLVAPMLWAGTAVVTLASAVVTFAPWGRPLVTLLSVGAEGNIPTWWNSGLLLLAALVAVTVAALAPAAARPGRRSWLVAGGVLALLSMDEASGLHERLGVLGSRVADAMGLELVTYSWLLPGVVVLAAGLVVVIGWLRALPADIARRLAVAVAVVLSGAVGMEALAGLMRAVGARTVMFALTAVEEALEMAGCVLIVLALLRALRWEGTSVEGRRLVHRESSQPHPRSGSAS